MNRKKFIKNSLVSAAGVISTTSMLKANEKKSHKSTYDELMDQVGYNHLPNNEMKSGNTVLHKANTRGHANHGWLKSYHSFSFANYHNPERMHFGVLRVLNDDVVDAARGFGTHPHDNMEIISIPIEGDLEHKDSMGNTTVIKAGDVQVMSAGTGIYHSEYNKNKDRAVKFLQIWLFPKVKGVTPRYDQITLDPSKLKNRFAQILSPNSDDEGVWIHQDAWFYLGELEKGFSDSYNIKNKNNGVYAFVLNGQASINGQSLDTRDGFGIWDEDKIDIVADTNAKILLMDVPMMIND